MEFAKRITMMTQAAAKGDGAAVTACFTPDGVYHDVFYGAFIGSEITDLIEGHFHRDATAFRWDLHDPVQSGNIGYVRYVFSYSSRLPGHEGRRGLFEGVAICRLREGLISDYREVANAATGLASIGAADDKITRFVARETKALIERPEAAQHRNPQHTE